MINYQYGSAEVQRLKKIQTCISKTRSVLVNLHHKQLICNAGKYKGGFVIAVFLCFNFSLSSIPSVREAALL